MWGCLTEGIEWTLRRQRSTYLYVFEDLDSSMAPSRMSLPRLTLLCERGRNVQGLGIQASSLLPGQFDKGRTGRGDTSGAVGSA